MKKGENDFLGFIDIEKFRMRGFKRVFKIRRFFNLFKEDDVRKYVNIYRRIFIIKFGMRCLFLCDCLFFYIVF